MEIQDEVSGPPPTAPNIELLALQQQKKSSGKNKQKNKQDAPSEGHDNRQFVREPINPAPLSTDAVTLRIVPDSENGESSRISSQSDGVTTVKIITPRRRTTSSALHLLYRANKRPDFDALEQQAKAAAEAQEAGNDTVQETPAEGTKVHEQLAVEQPEVTDSDTNTAIAVNGVPEEKEIFVSDSDIDSDYDEDLWEDWEDERLQEPSPHAYYIPFRRYLVKVLSPTARKFLSDHLNQHVEGLSRSGTQRNWYGFADLMGKDTNYTFNMERFKDPFGEMLMDWGTEVGSTIGKMLHYLEQMDRYDIIDDTSFMDMIFRSVKTYDLERENHAREREEARNARKAEKRRLKQLEEDGLEDREAYQGFICFDEGDMEFVKELLYEMEEKQNLKICINARELLEKEETSISAEMIKARCGRMIVIISQYLVSEGNEMYDFGMRIAQSLSPASRSKMIPIRVDEGEMPHSFVHITPVDFTRCRERTWLWRKISATLRNPPDPLCIMERQKLRHIHLVPKEHAIDVRQVMKEENYKPPENPTCQPLRFPKPPREVTGGGEGLVLGNPERSELRKIPGTSGYERVLTTKQKIKRAWRNLFQRKPADF